MATKPIIEIDIEDAKFRDFIAKWDEYRESLHGMPAEWQALNKRVGEFQKLQMAAGVDAGVALDAAVKMESAYKKVATQQERSATATHKAATGFRAIEKHAKDLQKHIGGITMNLAKWSVLGAIGSGFGVGELASSAMNQRSNARGMNVSIGQAAAMKVNMSRFFDPEGLMGKVASATHNPNDYGAMAAMGLNPMALQSKGTFAASMQIANRARSTFIAEGKNLALAQAQGLTKFFTDGQLMRMANTPQKDWERAQSATVTDARQLGLGQGITSAWTRFLVQMRLAGNEIENTLIKGLAGLAPELEAISKGAVKFADAFVKDGGMKKALGEFESGLSTVAKFVESGQFQADARKLAVGTGQAAVEIAQIVRFLEPYAKFAASKTPTAAKKVEAAQGAVGKAIGHVTHGTAIGAGRHWFNNLMSNIPGGPTYRAWNNPLDLMPGGKEQNFKSTSAGIRAGAALLASYPKAHGADTIASIIPIWNGHGKNDPAYIANVAHWSGIKPTTPLDMQNRRTMARLIAAMSRQEGTDRVTPQQVRAALARHLGASAHPATIAAASTSATPDRTERHLAAIERHLKGLASKSALPKANVAITNSTGAHVAVSANALAY
jgi:hypothetical protein